MTRIGQPVYGFGVANLRIGSSIEGQESMRIKATRSGTMVSLKYNQRHGPSYSDGTGGTTLCRLMADDGTDRHLPNESVELARFEYTDILSTPSGFIVVDWDVPVAITQGVIYHVWFTNIDADPVANYASVNNFNIFEHYDPPAITYPDNDLAVLWKSTGSAGTWWQNGGHLPMYQFLFSAGEMQSQGYVGAYNSSGNQAINPTNKARIQVDAFTGPTFTATKFAAICRKYGSPPPLTVTIKEQDESNPYSFEIAASVFHSDTGTGHWFAEEISYLFISGLSYFIEFSMEEAEGIPGTDYYDFYPLNNGEVSSDFENGGTLLNGKASNYVDGGPWHDGWENHSDLLNIRQNCDLTVYCED